MESWRRVWREGVLPQLTRDDLLVIEKALENNDSRLVQHVTTRPPPIACVQDWPCECACLWGFIGAFRLGGLPDEAPGDGVTVGEVEEFFARLSYEVDRRLGEAAASRWFLNFWDDNPREQVFKEMLEEVRMNLEEVEADECIVVEG